MCNHLVRSCRAILGVFVFAGSSLATFAAPFKGSFHTHHADEFVVAEIAPSTYAPVAVNVDVAGAGIVLGLGPAICFTNDQLGDLTTGHLTATYILRSICGDDTIVLSVVAMQTVFDPVAGHVEAVGTFTIVGGTGRFATATGQGSCEATADFDFPLGGATNSGPGGWEFSGSIQGVARR